MIGSYHQRLVNVGVGDNGNCTGVYLAGFIKTGGIRVLGFFSVRYCLGPWWMRLYGYPINLQILTAYGWHFIVTSFFPLQRRLFSNIPLFPCVFQVPMKLSGEIHRKMLSAFYQKFHLRKIHKLKDAWSLNQDLVS